MHARISGGDGQVLTPFRQEAELPVVVVGVVGDVRYSSLDVKPVAAVYVPGNLTTASLGGEFVVRTDRAAATVLAALLRMIEGNPLWSIAWAGTADDLAGASLRGRALRAWLFGAFGVLGLLILGSGLFGMLSIEAARRTREFGVRLAVGATPGRILRLLAGDLLRPVLVGVVLGIGASVWALAQLEPYLYQTVPAELDLWAGVVGAVIMTAWPGALSPALRMSRVDPVVILRSE
jgi:hypothetical protein